MAGGMLTAFVGKVTSAGVGTLVKRRRERRTLGRRLRLRDPERTSDSNREGASGEQAFSCDRDRQKTVKKARWWKETRWWKESGVRTA